ncbi:flagellar type III secretion system pore protein FliP [Thioalkalivibrio sp. XN279]|uniref:flagellar type III secretion system pore protein FliP n=1 Tax=Thioalkalivibrio sp. XN279 TaxID=2714953 RepID=UPI001F114AB0|nr:flagellar type III secretion system pore protein FliP [Thioalkalivibrio sp. XN279]
MMRRALWRLLPVLPLLLSAWPGSAAAGNELELLSVATAEDGTQQYSVTLQVLLLMTLLSLVPAALIMTTSFTRIIVVLAILRQGMGTQQTPNNQVLIGLALFLSFFIMAPVLERIYEEAAKPYLEESLDAPAAIAAAGGPMREFMMSQVRAPDLELFASLGGHDGFESEADVPFSVLLPAFVTSELKTAFQIGFLLLLPFLIIDLVVAAVLMSMGMVMLSPLIISLPFKIMLFVLVDGWSLVMGTLAASFMAG